MSVTPRQLQMRGFTLIEVLITLFVFAVGILSVAGLQVYSKKANHDAYQRTTASMLTYDMVERMRANATQLSVYVSGAGTGLGGASLSAPLNCATTNCTPEQLAAYDLWQWERALDGVAERNAAGDSVGGLVSPTACIRGPAGGGTGLYTVVIVWRGSGQLLNSTSDDCGNGTGRYGTGDASRRILHLQTHITLVNFV